MICFQRETIVGRITELLAESNTGGFGIAVVDAFQVATNRHDRLGMPYLVQHQVDPSFVIIHTKVFPITANYFCVKINLNHTGYRV
jgi:hypothetical protein